MRIIYLGSGEFGLPTLRRLHAQHELLMVVSQPDRPAGRQRRLTPTPTAQWAAEHGVPALKSDDINRPEHVEALRELRADAAVVIAFGQKLSAELIGALGPLVVNLHSSLLPRFRGAAPINWAILAGEAETGLSVIALAQRMDAGLIHAQARTPIDPLETAGELHDRLATMGPALIAQVLRDHQQGTLRGQVQDDTQATRAPKLSKADSKIDFAAPAAQVRRRVHGLTPWPGVHVIWQRSDGRRQELILRRVAEEPGHRHDASPGTMLEGERVAVGNGAVRLLEVQMPGGKPMRIEDFVRGHPLTSGDVLLSE